MPPGPVCDLRITWRVTQAVSWASGLSWGVRAMSSPSPGPCSMAWPELGVALDFAWRPVPDGGFAVRVQQRELGCDRRQCMRGCGWVSGLQV